MITGCLSNKLKVLTGRKTVFSKFLPLSVRKKLKTKEPSGVSFSFHRWYNIFRNWGHIVFAAKFFV